MIFKDRKQENIFFAVFIILGTLIYGTLIFNENIWLDEAWSMLMARDTYWGLTKTTAVMQHPPLYYYFLKIVMDIFGETIWILKLVSILPVTLLMVFSMTKIRRYFGSIAAAIFIFSLITMPQMLRYGVQLRMYTWAMLFLTIAGVAAYEVLKEHSLRNWAKVTVFSLLAAYTHYYALVAAAFLYLWLLIYFIVKERRYLKQWFICAGVTILFYLPWMIVLIKQVMLMTEDYWIEPITFAHFMIYIKFPFVVGNDLLSFLLVVIFGAVGIRFLLRKKAAEDWYPFFGGITALGILAAGLTVSFIIRPFYTNRYMFCALGLMWLFFAIEVSKLGRKWIAAILVCMALMGGVAYQIEWETEYAEGVDEFKEFADRNFGEDDFIVNSNKDIGLCFQIFYPEIPLYDAKNADITLKPELTEEYKKHSGTMWYFLTPGDDAHMEGYLDAGYEFDDMGQFSIDSCLFEIYKVTMPE